MDDPRGSDVMGGDLAGKVAVVTGGASGIGLGMARRLAREGMKLVLGDIEEPALEIAAKELRDSGAEVLPVVTNVADAASVDDLARQTLERFGTVHVVCNNAGVGGHAFAVSETPLSEWQWVLGVNLWGVIHGLHAFLPVLIAQDEGHVVNTASVAGLGGLPFMAPYAATKHAVVGISEALFHELAFAGSNVRVSVLCPGWVNTNIMDSSRNWPSRLGAEPARPENDAASQLFDQFARDAIAGGMGPDDVGALVVDAIRTRRFMVLTEDKLGRAGVEAKLAELDGADPPLAPIL